MTVGGQLIGYRRDGDTLYELPEREIRRRRAEVGMVFQGFNLFPHLTALENIIEAPIAVRGVPRAQAEQQAHTLLERVGLADKADAFPRQLSGGQQQRIAIARALALQPKVLLFDEPTSALDPELVAEVLSVIEELARSGTTLVIVTHELSFARRVADHVVMMDQGRVIEQGTPEALFERPRQQRTADSSPRPCNPGRNTMSPAAPRRPSRSTLLIAGVLVIGIAGIVYSRVRQAPDVGAVAATSLAGANTAILKGTLDPKAQALIPAGYRFVTPGAFTVATHPGQLPLADYGADSKDVVGIEPDIARLIADALGLKLVIVPVAWADWPLGLESGKYDAVLSNVTVTEERKKKFDSPATVTTCWASTRALMGRSRRSKSRPTLPG